MLLKKLFLDIYTKNPNNKIFLLIIFILNLQKNILKKQIEEMLYMVIILELIIIMLIYILNKIILLIFPNYSFNIILYHK